MPNIILFELSVDIFSKTYGLISYGSGWRKNVVNQRSVLVAMCADSILSSICTEAVKKVGKALLIP